MTGVATVGCSTGILALVLAGCSGMIREDDGLGSGGATRVHHDGSVAPSSGASGGKGAGGTTSGTGGFSNPGDASTGGANTGGVNTGGAVDCSYDPSSPEDPSSSPSGTRVALPVVCDLGGPYMCRFSAAQLLEGYKCSPDTGMDPGFYLGKFHIVGCGYETVGYNGGYGGPSETFSLSTGERVGATLSSDVTFGPCDGFYYRAGRTHADCPGAVRTTCVPFRAPRDGGGWDHECTDWDWKRLDDLPSRPECDCSGDPGIDPCSWPRSCECWCSQFAPAAQACAGKGW